MGRKLDDAVMEPPWSSMWSKFLNHKRGKTYDPPSNALRANSRSFTINAAVTSNLSYPPLAKTSERSHTNPPNSTAAKNAKHAADHGCTYSCSRPNC